MYTYSDPNLIGLKETMRMNDPTLELLFAFPKEMDEIKSVTLHNVYSPPLMHAYKDKMKITYC